MKTRFVCQECAHDSLRWEGRCPRCGAWNSLEPVREAKRPRGSKRAAGGSRATSPVEPLTVPGATPAERMRLEVGEVDAVLGGGFVPGSVALLGGAPGVGKSTLALQLSTRAAATGQTVLYASGEESREQVARRAARLGGDAEAIRFAPVSLVGEVIAAAAELSPTLVFVDSVHTLSVDGAAPGTVRQVRECANQLQQFAKATGAATVLVGHVTKGGAIAGPRTLEHLVDVVLVLEHSAGADLRLLRGTKNRFGGVGELAVFRMSAGGLDPVLDPGAELLAGRGEPGPGSALTICLEGSRPVVAEIQALTSRSRLPHPRRMASGISPRRLAMLLAVLARRGGLDLDESDVFVNVAGGVRISDPAADAAVLAALVSSELDRPLPARSWFLGEAGLAGDLRQPPGLEVRVREAERLGLEAMFGPRSEGAGGEGVDMRTARDLVSAVRASGTAEIGA